MAMNKKEVAELEAAKTQAALRWTAPTPFDVFPPQGREPNSSGWTFNEYSMSVSQGWSSSVSHGSGAVEKNRMCGSQNARKMFSTKVIALRAMRFAVEQECASRLRKIDQMIESETANA